MGGFGLRCLVDAMVLIDGARYGFLEALLRGHEIAVAESVFREVMYWKDDAGLRHPIDLSPFVRDRQVEVLRAHVVELADVVGRIDSRALGGGELESLAIASAHRERFCTADRVAKRAMGELGIGELWVSLADLLGALDPPVELPEPKYDG
jgi:hypothetical protein